MMRRGWILFVCLGVCGALRADDSATVAMRILKARCVGCHGSKKKSGKLRVDTVPNILQGGRRGPAVVPGKSAESLLFARIQPDAKKRMPPKKKGDPLTAEEVEAIRVWIDAGAVAAKADATSPPEVTVVKTGSLPEGFAPVFSLAADPTASRLALGRGSVVEIYEVPLSNEKPKGATETPAVKVVTRLPGQADIVQSLAFSPDGKLLAAGEYRVVRVWKTEGWELLHTLEGHADRAVALAFSPDGKRLAVAGGLPSESGEIKAWDLERGAPLWTASLHTDTVLGLDWSRDGSRLITGGADRVTYLLDAATGKELRRLEGHTHHVLAVAFSPDGKQAATAGADNTIRIWDLENGRVLRNPGKHNDAATAVAYQDDGKHIVSASADGTVRFWDPERGNVRRTFSEPKTYLHSGALFLSGKRYATADQHGTLWIYDLEKNRLLFKVDGGSDS